MAMVVQLLVHMLKQITRQVSEMKLVAKVTAQSSLKCSKFYINNSKTFSSNIIKTAKHPTMNRYLSTSELELQRHHLD